MKAHWIHNVIAVAFTLVAQSSVAVTLSPSGIGQALIYPYYTVNNSQDTLISAINASAVGKAVHVRVREGYNGRSVLEFNVFLSPYDVWTAAITQTAGDGGALLKTSDASCTDPIIPSAGVALRSAGYDGSGPLPADDGPQGITRTREGEIELIVIGDVDPASDLAGFITHVDGIPPGCASINDVVAQVAVIAPTGGIYGSAAIVNVGEGTFFPYNADAIQGFSAIPLYSPSGTPVSLQDANSSEAVHGVATAYVSTASGAPLALDYAFGIDAVSAVFMADTLYNEYVVAASLGANTDWIVTFPTKEYYVDSLYGSVPFTPFVEAFHAPGASNVVVTPTAYDREEGAAPPPICETGCIAIPPFVLPYQVNVLPFFNDANFVPGSPSGVFGSVLTWLNIVPFGDDGNVTIDLTSGDGGHEFPGGVNSLGVAVTLSGLPTTGFMAYNVINAHAQPGLLANYSGAFHHRSTSECTGSVDGCR